MILTANRLAVKPASPPLRPPNRLTVFAVNVQSRHKTLRRYRQETRRSISLERRRSS
jgi:hypothetical protein